MLNKILGDFPYPSELTPFYLALKEADKTLDSWPIDFQQLHLNIDRIEQVLPPEVSRGDSYDSLSRSNKMIKELLAVVRFLSVVFEGVIHNHPVSDLLEAAKKELVLLPCIPVLNKPEILIALMRHFMNEEGTHANLDLAVMLFKTTNIIAMNESPDEHANFYRFQQFFKDYFKPSSQEWTDSLQSKDRNDSFSQEIANYLYFIYGNSLVLTKKFDDVEEFLVDRNNGILLITAQDVSRKRFTDIIVSLRVEIIRQLSIILNKTNSLFNMTQNPQVSSSNDHLDCAQNVFAKVEQANKNFNEMIALLQKMEDYTVYDESESLITDKNHLQLLEKIKANPGLLDNQTYKELIGILSNLFRSLTSGFNLNTDDIHLLTAAIESIYVNAYMRFITSSSIIELNDLSRYHADLQSNHPGFTDETNLLTTTDSIFELIEINLVHEIFHQGDKSKSLVFELKKILNLIGADQIKNAHAYFHQQIDLDNLPEHFSYPIKFVIYLIAAYLQAQDTCLNAASTAIPEMNKIFSDNKYLLLATQLNQLNHKKSPFDAYLNKQILMKMRLFLRCQNELIILYKSELPERLADIHSTHSIELMYKIYLDMLAKTKALSANNTANFASQDFIECIKQSDKTIGIRLLENEKHAKTLAKAAKLKREMDKHAVKAKLKKIKLEEQFRGMLSTLVSDVVAAKEKELKDVNQALLTIVDTVVYNQAQADSQAKKDAKILEKKTKKYQAKAAKKAAKFSHQENSLDELTETIVPGVVEQAFSEILFEEENRVAQEVAIALASDVQVLSTASSINDELPIIDTRVINPIIKEFLEILEKHGAKRARLVGGFPKGITKTTDLDVVSELELKSVCEAFIKNPHTRVEIQFDKLKIIYKGLQFDHHESWALQGKKTAASQPEIMSDLEAFRADALLRDFTCNTKYMDKDGNGYDPLGFAQRDIVARNLFPVSEVDYLSLSTHEQSALWLQSFKHDTKRIFRAIYFQENEKFSQDKAFHLAIDSVLPILKHTVQFINQQSSPAALSDADKLVLGSINSILLKLFRSNGAIAIYTRLSQKIIDVLFPGLASIFATQAGLNDFIIEELRVANNKISLNYIYKLFAFVFAMNADKELTLSDDLSLATNKIELLKSYEKKYILFAYNFNPYGIDNPKYSISDDFHRIILKYRSFERRTGLMSEKFCNAERLRSDSSNSELNDLSEFRVTPPLSWRSCSDSPLASQGSDLRQLSDASLGSWSPTNLPPSVSSSATKSLRQLSRSVSPILDHNSVSNYAYGTPSAHNVAQQQRKENHLQRLPTFEAASTFQSQLNFSRNQPQQLRLSSHASVHYGAQLSAQHDHLRAQQAQLAFEAQRRAQEADNLMQLQVQHIQLQAQLQAQMQAQTQLQMQRAQQQSQQVLFPAAPNLPLHHARHQAYVQSMHASMNGQGFFAHQNAPASNAQPSSMALPALQLSQSQNIPGVLGYHPQSYPQNSQPNNQGVSPANTNTAQDLLNILNPEARLRMMQNFRF